MKNYKYYVIGGQYVKWCYGGANSIPAAKKIANDCIEYWDNHSGFHKPAIYRAEDTEIIIANGETPGYREGAEYSVPAFGAEPIVPTEHWGH